MTKGLSNCFIRLSSNFVFLYSTCTFFISLVNGILHYVSIWCYTLGILCALFKQPQLYS